MDISTGMYSAISGRRVEPDYVQGLEPLRRGGRIKECLKSAENRDTSRSGPHEQLLAEPWTSAAPGPGARQLMGAPLTKENLRHFKRTQRGKATEERGFPSGSLKLTSEKTNASETSFTEITNSRATQTLPFGFNFKACRNGVLGALNSKAPTNSDHMLTRSNRERNSPPPSISDFREYSRKVRGATIVQNVLFAMTKIWKDLEVANQGYRMNFNTRLSAPKDVGFNNGLGAPVPSVVHGLARRAFDPFPVEEQLENAAFIAGDRRHVTLPHFTGDLKSPRQGTVSGRMLNAYAAATLVHGRNEALKFLDDPDPHGHAVVTSFSSLNAGNISTSTQTSASHLKEPRSSSTISIPSVPRTSCFRLRASVSAAGNSGTSKRMRSLRLSR